MKRIKIDIVIFEIFYAAWLSDFSMQSYGNSVTEMLQSQYNDVTIQQCNRIVTTRHETLAEQAKPIFKKQEGDVASPSLWI